MVSMASNLMLADERVLWMAQREALACSRIISCLQKIAASRLATPQAFSLVSPVSDTLGPRQLGFFTHTVTHTDKISPNMLYTVSFEHSELHFLLLTLPDVPQHRSGGSCCQGQRLERHDLHVVPEAEPRAHARTGTPPDLQMQHDQLLQHPSQGQLPPEPAAVNGVVSHHVTWRGCGFDLTVLFL